MNPDRNPGPRHLSRAVIVAMLATLGACATVGPDYRLPSEAVVSRPAASAGFAGARQDPALFHNAPLPPQWWRLYHDVTLDGLIDKAFIENADLKVAAANLARARAVEREVAGAREPVLGLNLNPGYGRQSAAARGLAAPLQDTASYDTGAAISYQVDVVGRITRAIEAAGADADAALAAADLARVTVAAQTASAYVDICASGRQIRVAQKSVDTQSRFVELTAERVQAGRASVLENSRAMAQLDQLRAALPPLLAQHRVAQYRLSVLTGEVPGELRPALDACEAPPVLAGAVPVGDGAALLRRRPDIRQAERAVAAASARIGVATAELYPSVSLGLSAGSTGALEHAGAGNAFRWSLGPLISWTLPGPGVRARIAEAEAADAAALARFDGVVLKALLETETALTGYARELDRNDALRAARDQSALASGQAATLYRYGRTDFLTTLDAERTLATADSALAASDGKLAGDRIQLFLALGGGWEQGGPDLPDPAGRQGDAGGAAR
jgi:multidrug efflux system outer membrane protein